MTTNYHTDIIVGAAANAGTINNPLRSLDQYLSQALAEIIAGRGIYGSLDTRFDVTEAEIIAGRGSYPNLDARMDALGGSSAEVVEARGTYTDLDSRLDSIVAAGGQVVATVASNTATVTVPVGTGQGNGFTVGAHCGYTALGQIYYNTIAGKAANSLTLASTPAGTIQAASLIFQITDSEYQTAFAVNAAASGVNRTMPNAMDWAASKQFNVMAFGADNTGSTDSYAAFNAAIAAAKAVARSVVVIPQGTYYTTLPIIVEDANQLSMIGVGMPNITVAAALDTEALPDDPGIITFRNCNHGYIAGIKVDGAGCISCAGIQLRYTNHTVVSRCISSNVQAHTGGTQSGLGIWVSGDSKWNRVEYCRIFDAEYSGVDCAHDDVVDPTNPPPAFNLFFGNYIEGTTIGDGFDIYQTVGTQIINNYVYNAGREGINPTGASITYPNRELLIQGNVVAGTLGNGIFLDSYVERCRIIGNFVTTSQDSGINIDNQANTDVLVIGNHCYKNGKHGIACASERTLIEGNQLVENGTNTTHRGIYLWGGAERTQVVGNRIFFNTGPGIYADTVNFLHIANNYVERNFQHGIHLLSSLSHTIDGNHVQDNYYQGIYLQDTSRCLVQGNHMIGNSAATHNAFNNLHLTGTSSDNSIQSNKFYRGYNANKAYAAIRIENNTCQENWIGNNDLKDGGLTAFISDLGTLTQMSPENRTVTYTSNGTWTPTMSGATTPPSAITYNQQVGTYTRQNKLVMAMFNIGILTRTGGTGDAILQGLPFPPIEVTSFTLANFGALNNQHCSAYAQTNSTCKFYTIGTTGIVTVIPITAIVAGFISGTIVYTVA